MLEARNDPAGSEKDKEKDKAPCMLGASAHISHSLSPEIESFVKYLKDLKIEPPLKRSNIAIFPVAGKNLLGNLKKDLLTLDEAMEKGALIAEESEDEQVNQIVVQNRSKSWIFIYPRMNGVIVAIGDKILGIDLFGSPEIFLKLWPGLLKSYLLEAMTRGVKDATVTVKEVKQLLEELTTAKMTTLDPPGEGTLITIKSQSHEGAALTFNKELVHANIFFMAPASQSRQPDYPQYDNISGLR
jgi:hypothetical protein